MTGPTKRLLGYDAYIVPRFSAESKLVGVRMRNHLRKRIEEHRTWLREHTSLDLSLGMVIKSLVERGLAAFDEEQKPAPRKR